jgi:hypothetical protein
MILIAKRNLVEQYYDYDMVMRHERAHCEGWRHDIVVAEKPKADVAETPSPEKKPRVAAKPAENAPTARPTARTAERRATPSGRQAHMPWPLAMLASAIVTPFRAIAGFR